MVAPAGWPSSREQDRGWIMMLSRVVGTRVGRKPRAGDGARGAYWLPLALVAVVGACVVVGVLLAAEQLRRALADPFRMLTAQEPPVVQEEP